MVPCCGGILINEAGDKVGLGAGSLREGGAKEERRVGEGWLG